jgi:hypothetical protein
VLSSQSNFFFLQKAKADNIRDMRRTSHSHTDDDERSSSLPSRVSSSSTTSCASSSPAAVSKKKKLLVAKTLKTSKSTKEGDREKRRVSFAASSSSLGRLSFSSSSQGKTHEKRTRTTKSLTKNNGGASNNNNATSLNAFSLSSQNHLKGVIENERVIRDENGKDVTPRSLLEPCRWTRKNEAFGGGKDGEEEEGWAVTSDEESASTSSEDEGETKMERSEEDNDAILSVDFSKLWERQSLRVSRRIALSPIEFVPAPAATKRRKNTKIKKKRVSFDPEIHVHRSTQTYVPPCAVGETSTDSPETKESATCWRVQGTKKEGGGQARKHVHRAFLERVETIVDRQIRASLTLEQTLRYRGAFNERNGISFDASKKLTRLYEYKYPTASSSEYGKEKRVNAIRFHPYFDGVVIICHGSVDADEFVPRSDDYDEKVDENKRNLAYFKNRDLEKRGAVHVWSLRDTTNPEVSITLDTPVTAIALQRVHYTDAEDELRNKSKRILCGCLDGSVRCFDVAFRGGKEGSTFHQHHKLLYESRPEHSHREAVWSVEFIDHDDDEVRDPCEFSAVSCSTDGTVLRMDGRAKIPSESAIALRTLHDTQHREEKRFLESSGETILESGSTCDDSLEIQATCLDVIDQSCLLVGTIRGDVFVCVKRLSDVSDGRRSVFTIVKKIKAHSMSSLYAAIYQIKKHPSIPGVFATASADGTVRIFRVLNLERKVNCVETRRARDTHTNNINDLCPETSSSIFEETDPSQMLSFVPAPSRVKGGKDTSSSTNSTSSSSRSSTTFSVSLPPVNDIAWDTNDGTKLAAVYDDGTLRIWNCESALVQNTSSNNSSNNSNIARSDASLTVTTPWFEEKFDEVGVQQKSNNQRGETKNILHLTAVSYSNANTSPILAVGDSLGNVHVLSVAAAAQNEDDRRELHAIDDAFVGRD